MEIKTDLLSYPENPKVVQLPPAGGKYIDDLAGAEVLRLTDERDGFGKSFSTTYSVWNAFNADNTRVWLFEHGGSYHVANLNPTTLERVGPLEAVDPARGSFVDYESAVWSNDPDKIFLLVDCQIWSYKPSRRGFPDAYQVVADLRSSFPVNARFNQLYVSKDNNRFASVVRSGATGPGDYGVMCYERSSNSVKLNVSIDNINGITMGKDGRYILLVRNGEENYTKQHVYNVDTGQEELLISEKNTGLPDFCIGHNDIGDDFVIGGDHWRGSFTSRKMSAPHSISMPWQYATSINGWLVGWHVSMLADNESWVLVSTFGGLLTRDSKGEAVTLEDGPFIREIFQLGVKDPFIGQFRRLVHTRANWVHPNYWYSPRGTISRDGRLLAWTGNNNGPSGASRTDVMIAKIDPAPTTSEPLPPPPPPPPTTVSISGKILKKDGSPVKGVRVMINPGTKTQATTKDDGSFSFTGLKPGRYVVIAGASNAWWVYQPGYRAVDVKQNVSNADFVAVDSNDPSLFI